MSRTCDFLVIGTGLAGLSFALKSAEFGQVIILAKSDAPHTNTAMAQGGIAAVYSTTDSFESHIKDTMEAGAGLCHENIVRLVVESAPDRIDDLIQWGVEFDTQNNQPDLTREGGHSHRRILHIQDQTGAGIHQALLKRVRQHPNIEIFEQTLAVDLILNREFQPFSIAQARCLGAHVIDRKSGRAHDVFSRMTVLATGGAGKVYLYTSNWDSATGDGIAMAYRAGARIANLEFMQFHPTCLFHPKARNFLITEALRGEGAHLLNAKGERFITKHHPMAELAPRDIVARSIDAEMKMSGAESVFLDISHRPADYLRERFPVVYRTCLDYGIDMTKQPIPVVPAAHYLCGGVLTDDCGHTDIKGLFAVGETACTGLHGANRLASNSLLECLVFSHRAAEWAKRHLIEFPKPDVVSTNWSGQGHASEDEMIVVAHSWNEIRRLMWNYVGIVRSNRRLLRAAARLDIILNELREYPLHRPAHPDIVELHNLALVAKLTVDCALARHESRGIHYSLDFPETPLAKPIDTILGKA